jgi:hypothetical protein
MKILNAPRANYVQLVKRSAHSVSVSYEYSLKEKLHEPFAWVASAWTSCNASCGDGEFCSKQWCSLFAIIDVIAETTFWLVAEAQRLNS